MRRTAEAADPEHEAADMIEELAARGRRLDVDCKGGRLAFRVWGEGRPLLLLHGGFGSWLHWIRNVEALANHCQVIAVDLPGLGDSDLLAGPPDGMAIAAHIAEGLDIAFPDIRSLTIAGFSLGGAIGAALAHRIGSRLHHLVLIGPAGLGELWQDATSDLQRYWRDMSESERRAVTRHNLGRSMIADESKIDALAIAVQSKLLRDKPRLRGLLISRSEILLTNVAALPSHDVVTVVWGEHDPYPVRGARAGGEFLSRRFPGVTVEIFEKVGHWTAYETPAAVNALLLSRVLATAPADQAQVAS